MFLIGLLFGPAVGLLLADFLLRPGGIGARISGAVFVLAVLVVLAVPAVSLELKLGLVPGLLLGLLLAYSPVALPGVDQESDIAGASSPTP
jgi:hypothetical protein